MKPFVTYTEWIDSLSEKLKGERTGTAAHLKLMPESRKAELQAQPKRLPRKSAVLLLFFPLYDRPHFVLIKRAIDGGVHSHQMALPGGQYETKDYTLKQTALRESFEEIGVPMNKIKVIGSLTKLYIPPSNFNVYPFVGYLLKHPLFKPNEEVEKILEVDIAHLLHPETLQTKKLLLPTGKEINVPCYYLDNEIVWGATAMILSELVATIG